MKRPLVWIAVAFACGIWAAGLGLCSGGSIPTALIAAGLALALATHSAAALRPWSGALCFFGVGALLWNAHHQGPSGDQISALVSRMGGSIECTVEGRVRMEGLEQAEADHHRFLIDATAIETLGKRQTLRGGVLAGWTKPGARVYAGQVIRIRGSLRTAIGRVNPDTSSYEDYVRNQGIHTALQAKGRKAVQVVSTPTWSVAYWASRLRAAQVEGFQRAVPKEALPFVQAIWLGYRAAMPEDEYQAFLESGTIHILSVSGLHMSMIYVTAAFLIGLVVRHPRRKAILCALAIVLFTLMTGMRPSALRSAIMVLVFLAAELFGREPDAPTALGESAILLLGVEPDLLFDGGFQLSFLCVASMLLFGRPLADRLTWIPMTLRGPIATCIAVQLLPFPLAVLNFHVLPMVAAPANLMLVPLSTVALWLCLVVSLLEPVVHVFGLLFGYALGAITELIVYLARGMTQPAFSHWYLTAPTLAAIVAYYAMLACLCPGLWPRGATDRTRRRIRIAAAGLGMGMILLWTPPASTPRVVFLDVGHGDAAFVCSKGGHTVLVDAALANKSTNMARQVVAPYLWANHVSSLDVLAISHADNDHIGGAFYLLEHFPVGQVLLGPNPAKEELEPQLVQLCRRRGIPVHFMRQGESVALPEMVLTALHPPEEWSMDNANNDGGLVLRLDWLGTRFLFTGDIESVAEPSLAQIDCRAEILKVPHHGSDTSSSPLLVAAVQPKHAIISTGGEKSQESVSAAVVDRYRRRGIHVWRTDLMGAIEVRRSPAGPVIQSARAARGYPVPSGEERPETPIGAAMP